MDQSGDCTCRFIFRLGLDRDANLPRDAAIPLRITDTAGVVVAGDGDVGRGQNVWQALGGMEVGSIWGHGSYVAPDWTADWLHQECA